MTKRFRKKPVEVEAVQWTGENRDEVRAFVGDSVQLTFGATTLLLWSGTVHPGGFVIRNPKAPSEVFVRSEAEFQATYEPADQGLDGDGLEDFDADDLRLIHHAVSMGIDLYDAVEEGDGVPKDAPLYGKRDRLAELARRIDHLANCAPASTQPVVDPRSITITISREGAETFVGPSSGAAAMGHQEIHEAIEAALDSKEKGTER